MLIPVHPTAWKRFWAAVDNEGVGLFQTMGYWILSLGAAVYNLFFATQPTEAVQGVMGRPYYEIWLSLLMVMPLVCLLGKRLSGNLTLTGMRLQLLGDMGTSGALFLFTVASIITTDWGTEGNIGGFSTFIIFLCTLIFILRDVRRLIQVGRKARR